MPIKQIIGLLIGALFLYLSLKDINLQKLLQTISKTNKLFVVISCSFFVLDSFLKWYKWAYIVKSIDGKIKKRDTFSPFVIGLGFNNLVPFKLGEILRIFILNLKAGLSKTKIIISIYTEKLYEGTTLLVLFLLSLRFILVLEWVQQLVVILLGLFIAILFVTFLIVKHNRAIAPILQIERVSRFIQHFSDHSDLLTHFDKILYISALSLLMWCFEALLVWNLSNAFSFDLSYVNCIFVASVLNFGIFVPTSPGSIGTFEFLIIKSLSLLHISKINALSFALVLHTILFVPFIVGGIILFVQEGISLKNILKLSRRNA